MSKAKIVKSAEVMGSRNLSRKSPMIRLIESVDGDFWIMKQVAAHLGVHQETIRRVVRRVDDDGKKVVKAPSQALTAGRVAVYLFDKDDVIELENYFIDSGYLVNHRINPKKTLASQVPK